MVNPMKVAIVQALADRIQPCLDVPQIVFWGRIALGNDHLGAPDCLCDFHISLAFGRHALSSYERILTIIPLNLNFNDVWFDSWPFLEFVDKRVDASKSFRKGHEYLGKIGVFVVSMFGQSSEPSCRREG